jgi:(p)ppGpp synthase/HD superfamily hydrolase
MNTSNMDHDSVSVFERAIAFATRAHAGAKRKGTGIPYIVHPIEAAAIASTMTTDEEMLAAAVLHDVLEDTEATPEELERLFGTRILRLVQDETENKRKDLPPQDTWKIRKQETITYLEERASREAKMLALADKLSNMRAIYRDFQILGDELWQRFNEKDKRMHAWMYRAISNALQELSEYMVWHEYNWLIDATFGKNKDE